MIDDRERGEWWEQRLRAGVCRRCGGVFTTRASQRRYCADPCREAAAREHRKAAWRAARCAHPRVKRAALARRYANLSADALWTAQRYAVAVARSRRPWIARAADGQRVPTGDQAMSFVVTPDLAEWLWKTCRRLECAPAALVRCALDYDRTGRAKVERAQRWRGRSVARPRLTVRLSVLQNAHLATAIRRPGYGGKSRALRRMLWRLKAVIDPPVSA